MNWLTDTYVILAGDVAAAFAARAYNLGRGRWETCSGTDPQPSRESRSYVRQGEIRVLTAGGAIKRGVFVQAWILGDPLQMGYLIPWFEGIQGCQSLVNWAGRQELRCGFLWRIHTGGGGGLVAGDIVTTGVGYEQ